MIQRIQTVYLLVSSLFMAGLFWLPVVSSSLASEGVFEDGILDNRDSISGILTGLIMILTITAIGSYQNRVRQLWMIRICSVLILLLVANAAYLVYQSTASEIQIEFGSLFPLLSLGCFFLAMRAIKKDEQTVRSMDRLR